MHIEKYKSDAVVGIMKHYTREHITDNVVKERVKDNVYCYNEKFNIPEKHKSRAIKNQILKDIDQRTARKVKEKQNVVLDLVITQPEEMGKELNKKFFDDMVNALQNRYNYNGFNPFKKENMVMYAIHQDEQGQPHMHYAFMPITPNHTRRIRHKENTKYRNIDLDHERLSSDSFMKLDFLKSFHSTMEVLTGYTLTKGDNEKRDLTMKEYQNAQDIQKLKNKIQEQDKEKETLKQLNNELDKENLKLIEKKKELKNEITELDKIISDKKDFIKEFERKIEYNEILIPELKEKKPTLTQSGNEIRFDRKQYEMQQQQLREFENLIRQKALEEKEKIKKEYDKIYQEREKTDYYKNYSNCETKINEAYERYNKELEMKDKKIESFANENIKLKNTLASYDKEKIKPLSDKIDKLDSNNKWLNKLIYNLEQFVLSRSDFTQKQLDYVEEHGTLPTQNRSQGLSM